MQILRAENIAVILFFVGIAGIFSSRRMLKTIVSIGIMQVAAITFYLTMFASPNSTAPIDTQSTNVADPLPQALMITAIVIGVAVTAIILVMFINLYHRYGNSDWVNISKKRMEHL